VKIKELELQNFKVFNSEKFKFRKITILAGANSAGKSTVLNSLAAILQGSESRPFPFYFSNYGENVHLGGFKDIVTGGNTNNKFSVGVTFESGKNTFSAKGTYRYASSGQQILVDSLNIKNKNTSLNVKWEGQEVGYKAFREINDSEKNKQNELHGIFMSSFSDYISRVSDDDKIDKNKLEVANLFENLNKSSTEWEGIEVKRSKDLYDSLRSEILYNHLLNPFKSSLNKAQTRISYVGPIRPHPSRHYFIQSHHNKMNAQGDNAFQLLIDWKLSNSKKFNKVTTALKFLNLAEGLTPKKIKDELVELNVKPIGQKHTVNLSDVGFGLSQVLPVLIATIDAEPNSSLLINQPEVHLHPSSQAQLADYFVSESKNKDFIIETHSEYLINRLRILVSKGEINKDDVSILYIGHGENGATVDEVTIDSHGALINAPESFFDTYYIDNNDLIFAAFNDEELTGVASE
jgi:predicted ATPase